MWRGACVLLFFTACDDAPRPGPRRSKADPPTREELIVTARDAVDAGHWSLAHNSLTMLEVVDLDGGLAEERLFLQVRTLMAIVPNEVAEEKADEFHRAFPRSALGPQVEDALLPLYRLQPGRQQAREAKVKALIRRSAR